VSSCVWTAIGNTKFKYSIRIIGSVPTHKIHEGGKWEGLERKGLWRYAKNWLTDRVTYVMEQSRSWEFNFSASIQESFGILLDQIYPVDAVSFRYFKAYLTVFVSTPPGYSRQSLRQVSPPKMYTYFFSLRCVLHAPHRLTFLI
jgi:hypothetical protein